MQTYNIDIDEAQRLHIIKALEVAKLPTNPDNDSVHMLLDMLKGMPEVEKDHPGTTHGLCL